MTIIFIVSLVTSDYCWSFYQPIDIWWPYPIQGTFALAYLYTAELFPTPVSAPPVPQQQQQIKDEYPDFSIW